MKAEAVGVEFGQRPDDTVDLHFDVTARLELAAEADVDWVLGVRVQGLGSRQQILSNGHTYSIPHNTNHTFIVVETQRPDGLGEGDLWQTRWDTTLSKTDILVDDNDQYLFWIQLMPDVQISPSREIFASVREDID
jgi:hypothetical protein